MRPGHAGADTDPFDRHRLLAGIEHRFHLVFGFFPGPAASAAALIARIHAIDEDADRPPAPARSSRFKSPGCAGSGPPTLAAYATRLAATLPTAA